MMMGMGMMGPRKMVSLGLGFCFLILGAIPLLHAMGTIGFTLPNIPALILSVICIIGGVFLFWDAVSEGMMAAIGITHMIMFGSYIIGLISLIIGAVPILHAMGAIAFTIPALGQTIISALFVVIGMFLLYGGTQGF